MSDKYHVGMLPGNTSGKDDIKTEQRIGRPIALIVKNPPKLLETIPSTPPPSTEEPKEVDFKDFPLLRGFV